mgnify:CR=1 FL=1
MKKYLLLDVGGVIILDSKSEAIRNFAENNNLEINSIHKLLKLYRQEKMRGKDLDLGGFLSSQKIDWISQSQLETLLKLMWDTEKPNGSLLETISILREEINFKIALVTNNYKGLLSILEKRGVEKFWDKVVNSSEIGLTKPDPEFFKATLAILQARPENCLFIDDNPKNIAGAAREGIAGIVYRDNVLIGNEIRRSFTRHSILRN